MPTRSTAAIFHLLFLLGGELGELQISSPFELRDIDNLPCVKGEMLCYVAHSLETGDAVSLDGIRFQEVRLAEVHQHLTGLPDGTPHPVEELAAGNWACFREFKVRSEEHTSELQSPV